MCLFSFFQIHLKHSLHNKTSICRMIRGKEQDDRSVFRSIQGYFTERIMACFTWNFIIHINGVLEINISKTQSVPISRVDVRQGLVMGKEHVSEILILDHQ